MKRFLDWLFFMYFLTHIPIALFIDFQALLPKWIYPLELQELVTWYSREFKDPMMVDPPAWFQAFIFTEIVFQLPFFFVATYVFWKGTENCRWIRTPLIVYSSHVSTVTLAISYHVLVNDFSKSKYPGPDTLSERLLLLSVYSPYLIIPFILLLDSLFNQVYNERPKERQKID